MIADRDLNAVVAGGAFEMTLGDVSEFLAGVEKLGEAEASANGMTTTEGEMRGRDRETCRVLAEYTENQAVLLGFESMNGSDGEIAARLVNALDLAISALGGPLGPADHERMVEERDDPSVNEA